MKDCVCVCVCVHREPREFAASNGECLACHPECLPQNGKQTCQGEVCNFKLVKLVLVLTKTKMIENQMKKRKLKY